MPVTGPLPICWIPNNHWYPDLDDLERKIKYNPAVAGILIINPDNPTGAVYPADILRRMVEMARRYDLFVIADEVYHNIVYNGTSTLPLSDLIGEVPGIAMRGVSKEMPWPGARCGWIEVYNGHSDSNVRAIHQVHSQCQNAGGLFHHPAPEGPAACWSSIRNTGTT